MSESKIRRALALLRVKDLYDEEYFRDVEKFILEGIHDTNFFETKIDLSRHGMGIGIVPISDMFYERWIKWFDGAALAETNTETVNINIRKALKIIEVNSTIKEIKPPFEDINLKDIDPVILEKTNNQAYRNKRSLNFKFLISGIFGLLICGTIEYRGITSSASEIVAILTLALLTVGASRSTALSTHQALNNFGNKNLHGAEKSLYNIGVSLLNIALVVMTTILWFNDYNLGTNLFFSFLSEAGWMELFEICIWWGLIIEITVDLLSTYILEQNMDLAADERNVFRSFMLIEFILLVLVLLDWSFMPVKGLLIFGFVSAICHLWISKSSLKNVQLELIREFY